MPIRLAIVDDRPTNITGLTQRLAVFADAVEVVITADNGDEFLRSLRTLAKPFHPQVVLMDIEMPVRDGISTVREATPQYPDILFLMLTVFEDDDKIFDAIQAGAMGYLLKDEPTERIVAAILEAIELGGSPMSPAIARKALRLLAQTPPSVKTPTAPISDTTLSDREIEILRNMADGLDYRDIAQTLFLSPHTVRTHITNIYRKLQVSSKIEAIKEGQKRRWF